MSKEIDVMYKTMCSLRIYLRRGDLPEATGFWARLFRRPLATHLVQAALKAGVTHASLTFGSMGFSKGAKMVATDITEIPVDTLPVCVELVGMRPLLDQFARDHAKLLEDATLVMLEGVHLRTEASDESTQRPSKVEYVRVGRHSEASHAPLEDVQAALGVNPPTTADG
jgi:PII-like signaling protein